MKIVLKKGREKSVLRKHPWIFSGAIQSVEGHPTAGETVDVYDAEGRFLARGAYSPQSQIAVRIWTFNPHEKITNSFFEQKIQKAISLRKILGVEQSTSAYRLIAAEADGLPGLIVDRYNDFLVCQFLSVGANFYKQIIIDILNQMLKPQGIYERSDVAVRAKEGLAEQKGVLLGDQPPDLLQINENGLQFLVDVKNGHKTGFYLDQRVNRKIVSQWAKNKKVLNCFAYTGGFGLAALKGGAKQVTNVEDVAGLLDLQEQNFKLNHFSKSLYTNIKADVFKLLRQFVDEGRQFDLIILDPPKFVDSQRTLLKGSRGYKDINRLALKLLTNNGMLFTFSCSGLMKMSLFQKIVADAALEANKKVQIVDWLLQSPDHPVVAHIPETLYLKGLMCKIID